MRSRKFVNYKLPTDLDLIGLFLKSLIINNLKQQSIFFLPILKLLLEML